MKRNFGLYAAMAAMAAVMAVAPPQAAVKTSGPMIHRRIPKPPRTPDPNEGAKMRKLNAKKGVGRARSCPTMRAIEAKRLAKVAASEVKLAA